MAILEKNGLGLRDEKRQDTLIFGVHGGLVNSVASEKALSESCPDEKE
jgi:hypothetical protein